MLASSPTLAKPRGSKDMTDAPPRQTILVVEDDQAVAQLIRLYLIRDGHDVLTASDGIEGLRLAQERKPSLIVLDLNLPKMDGIEVCRRLRADSQVPVVMVTARVDEEDRLAGLDLGADDYITKPFSPRELAARVRAVLRRSARETTAASPSGTTAQTRLVSGNLAVDLEAHSVTVGERPLPLTPTEYRILVGFMRAGGRVLTRDQIIESVFGYDFEGLDRTVDTHISNLRKKIELAGGENRIKTIYGSGYRFDA
jgi:two-component system alkaline phosphatase synthesis response regulator PhoP